MTEEGQGANMGMLRRLSWSKGLVVLLGLGLLVALVPLPSWINAYDIPRTLVLLLRAATLLAPGLALVLWLRPLEELDLLPTLCLSALASLALCPLLLFWLGFLGGHWSRTAILSLLFGSTVLAAWRLHRLRWPWGNMSPHSLGLMAALAGVYALTLALRLWVIQGIPYPPGADSYHHTIITQIILDTGRVPVNYHPYAEIDTFVYHFGFHAYSAFLSWITGLPAHRAVFWGAQVLNALTVPSVFFLVDRLLRDSRAALVAAIVAGLTCHMPAMYMIWGRNTQLMGQTILPAACILTVEFTCRRQFRWQTLLFASLMVAGFGLSHYRIAVFYLAFVAIFFLAILVRERRDRRAIARVALRLVALAAVALLITAPWLAPLLHQTSLMAQQGESVSPGTQLDALTLNHVLTMGLRLPLFIISALAALWAVASLRRRPAGFLTLLWLGLLVALATPGFSGIPAGLLTYRTIIIALYMPAALLIGLLASDLPLRLEVRAVRWVKGYEVSGRLRKFPLFLCLALLLSLWGVREAIQLRAEPRHLVVSNADIKAMEWVGQHTPAEARFAIDPVFYLSWATAGNDAGYWLPYAARRATIVPPILYTIEGAPGWISETTAFLRALKEAATPQMLATLLRQHSIQYAYVTGSIDNTWKSLLFDTSYFDEVYAADGVFVFRLR
jgi:hypothetical protein